MKNKITLTNEANSGGGIFIDNGNCLLNQSSINNNEVLGGSGGGIVVLSGNIYVQNYSHIDYNKAYNSAGIQEGNGNIYITNGSSVNNNNSYNSGTGQAGGGGITISLGVVYISNSQICNNKTLGMYSGGIVSLVGNVIIKESLICGNTNHGPGGGVAMNVGSLSISKSTIANNVGSSLAGGVVSFSPSPSIVSIDESQILSNTLTNVQTIKQSIGVFLSVVNNYLSGMSKQALLSGGSGGKKFIATIPEISQNISNIQNILNTLPIDQIDHNSIGGGGIGLLLPTSLIINKSIIKDNISGKKESTENIPFKAFGGGIYSFQAITNIQDSLIENNKSLTSGGGIWNNGEININNSKIVGNKSFEYDAGGIDNQVNGVIVLTNTKIEHNETKNNGGGIDNSGSLDMFSSSIAKNCASNGGGIYSNKSFNQFDSKIKYNCPDNIKFHT